MVFEHNMCMHKALSLSLSLSLPPFLLSHQAREMATNAFQFVQDHLLPQHLYCYIIRLLRVSLSDRQQPTQET